MITSNTTLQSSMTVIKMNPDLKTHINEYFTKAENALGEQVDIIFPQCTSPNLPLRLRYRQWF